MTIEDVKKILSKVVYHDWSFRTEASGNGFLVQAHFVEPDVDTGLMQMQHGRKWYVSAHSTESEIVQTALLAVIQANEHSVREFFTYRGRRVFGPHFNVNALVELTLIEGHQQVRK